MCWVCSAHVRGHDMAKAALESAVWDAEAKQKGVPLSKLLGGTRQEIASGVSIGIKASLDELAATVTKGTRRRLSAHQNQNQAGKGSRSGARGCAQDFPRIKLMVDANSAYTLNDVALLQQLEGFYLMMIEQPLGWDDLYSHVELQKQLDTPICLDECIHTEEQARAAIELGACKIINIKMGRVGGHTVARRIHDLCRAQWHSGVVRRDARIRHRPRAQYRAFDALRISLFPAMWPPANAIGKKTSSTPEVCVSAARHDSRTDGPGIGFEPRLDLIDKFTVRKERLA